MTASFVDVLMPWLNFLCRYVYAEVEYVKGLGGTLPYLVKRWLEANSGDLISHGRGSLPKGISSLLFSATAAWKKIFFPHHPVNSVQVSFIQ